MKVLDENGLLYLWKELKNFFVKQETGKGLSTNDFTTDEKTKLANIAANANNYTLPDATTSVKGGVIVGDHLSVSSGTISAQTATTGRKGVVQLSTSTTSSSTELAATASAVKAAYDLANGKQSPATTLAGYGITDAYTKTEVDGKISTVYKPAGSSTFASLPTPSASILGNVYNVTDSFNTTNAFVEGAGKTYTAGTNVVVVDAGGGTYKYDSLAGFVDLSDYALSSDTVGITNAEIDEILAQ